MRKTFAVIVPWLVWGIVDNVVYLVLLAVSPGSFDEQSIPTATVMLVYLLVLRASYSIASGWIAGKIAKGSRTPIPYVAGLLLLTGIIVQWLNWTSYPIWFSVGFLVPIVPCALLGAKLGIETPSLAESL